MTTSEKRRVIILGAAGRDFHNFNVFFRDHPRYRVVAFTATQIPGIAHRVYPAMLCGAGYPAGIPVVPEADLERTIREQDVRDVVFSYSDVTHGHVMHLAARVLAQGASFRLLGPQDTMLGSTRPVVAIVASRTGAGKSTVTRYLARVLRRNALRCAAVRHPMPYGSLERGVECYRSTDDIIAADLTLEEMEEYQPHVDEGTPVWAGVDYRQVLDQAEIGADVILWDGGNNDMSFVRPDVTVTVLDAARPGQEDGYFPGEANVRAADVLVIAKVNVAQAGDIAATERAARALNPTAPIVHMALQESVDHPELIRGQDVLAVEDGPSVTHGGLTDAAAARAVRVAGGRLVDPRPYASGSIADTCRAFPQLGMVLPALGYSAAQRAELQQSIAAVPCSAVVLGTPADLGRVLGLSQPVVRVRVNAQDVGTGSRTLVDIVLEKLGERLQVAKRADPGC